jgi:hypothetical protein
MKIFKKNKMFLLFKDYGFFVGGPLGVSYQKMLPLGTSILVPTNSAQTKVSNKYFFILKSQFKLFQRLISLAEYYLQLGCFLEIKINGIGYKCWRFNNNDFLFDLGYSHFVLYKNVYNIFFRLNRSSIRCFSLNFQLLGLVVSEILSLSKVDLYKGKGLFLSGTNLILKAGKQR